MREHERRRRLLPLTGARPLSTVKLVLGLARLDRPLLGGILVPKPLQVVALATDAAGAARWPFVLPPGQPSGMPLYQQAWIKDPLAVRGWAASNALSGTTP